MYLHCSWIIVIPNYKSYFLKKNFHSHINPNREIHMPSHHKLFSSLSIDLKFIHFFVGFKLRTELSNLKNLVNVRPTHPCVTIFELSHFMCQMDRKWLHLLKLISSTTDDYNRDWLTYYRITPDRIVHTAETLVASPCVLLWP